MIYVGTGEPDGEPWEKAGLGLMKSTDGGKTWNLLAASSFARGGVKRIRVHPTNADVLLAATTRAGYGWDGHIGSPSPPPSGILRSTDGGVTWIRTLAGQATALEVDPTNFNNQYAAIGEQYIPNIGFTNGLNNDSPGAAPNGIYRSTDGGQTWTPIAGPWGVSTATHAAVARIELAIAPSNPSVLYASVGVAPPDGTIPTWLTGPSGHALIVTYGLLGLFRTDNAWASTPAWAQIPTGATGAGGYCTDGFQACGYAHVIGIDPSDPDTFFGAGGGSPFWRCRNCRSASPEWTEVSSGLGGDNHVIVWAGHRLILGSDHGVWPSDDLGNTWQRTDSLRLPVVQFYRGFLHPTNPAVIVATIQDIGGVLHRPDSGPWMQELAGGLVAQGGIGVGEGDLQISARRPDTDWATTGHGSGNRIGRTLDGGKTWAYADTGIDKGATVVTAPVSKCPANDNVFLFGTIRMWRSDNFFNSSNPTWTPNSPATPAPSPIAGVNWPGSISAIEFADSDTSCNTYAYGTRGGQFQLTRDGGKTWTDLDSGKSLPARAVNGLAFDPTNPTILYVAISGFDDATPGKPGHVFKSTNALSTSPTWTNISPPLNEPFNIIRVDPTNPQLIYTGGAGLWRSTDAGVTWVHDGVETGLPNAALVYDIRINPNTKTKIVFTHGRGAYRDIAGGPQIISGSRSPANAATYIAGGLVPGSWAQVQGANLSGTTRIWGDADFVGLGNKLPTKLDGVEVQVNGIPAAVYYISPTGVTFQVPNGTLTTLAGNILGSSPVTVEVLRDGARSNLLTTTGTTSAPGIVPLFINGKNYPVGVFLDGKLTGDPAISPAFRNAKAGDVIRLFATGLIRTTSGIAPTPQSFGGVTVKIGEVSLSADSTSLASAGIFQINFRVPQQFATLPDGEYPISIQYKLDNGVSSSPDTINSDPPGPVNLPIAH